MNHKANHFLWMFLACIATEFIGRRIIYSVQLMLSFSNMQFPAACSLISTVATTINGHTIFCIAMQMLTHADIHTSIWI